MDRFFDAVQNFTEKRLTLRKARKEYARQHKSVLNEILSWLDALAFAVVVVFLINQFIFQLFVIPSPSMQDSLLIGDRVVVSKLTYGIETYPYGPKVFTSREPDRDDIITFYNPEYESKGAGFNILSRIVYMATFGLWNLEVDENGNPGEWLLVKRTGGKPGDTVAFRNGDAYIKLAGTSEYVNETDFRKANGYLNSPKRSIEKETYKAYNASGRLNGMTNVVTSISKMPKHLVEDYETMKSGEFFTDYYGFESQVAQGAIMADPTDRQARSDLAKKTIGSYVPSGFVLPLGDNRDNSTDGRYFGPIPVKTITGFACATFWPVSRIRSLVNR